MNSKRKPSAPLRLCVSLFFGLTLSTSGAQDRDPLAGHPRESYADVADIGAMEDALRKAMAAQERYSFSRSWWVWDRLRARYVDGGRKDGNALRVLRAVFRGLILDRHERLAAKGEGDLLYLFHTTLTSGDRKEFVLQVGDRTMYRDLHGGGYHGGWGGAARMRIYGELAAQNMLGSEEKQRFREIVHQSLHPRIIDFKAKAQTANNHSFGNAGGVALALKMFPDGAPQAAEARAWIDRIWGHLADFGDWTEWTYYPYGPIFLHGMLDIAEATGRIESERELINAIGARCLDFVHGGGVRGNPNSGAPNRRDLAPVYADPWNVGYYNVETSARDGQFWYRMAQHYQNPEYLWAAEQVALGGRPPHGEVPAAYQSAYDRRFAWFVERGIEPRAPAGKAKVGLLSPNKQKIPERLYLCSGRGSGQPFASFFLYDQKDEHLDNISGFLYEYGAGGAKFLHCSGKYNNVYSGDRPTGGGAGEESLDLLMVVHGRHPFPLHPDRLGDGRDPLRRGSIKHLPQLARANNNDAGDAFGQFAYDNYYGEGSRWVRRAVLTAEGYLVVADEYTGGAALADEYLAGPVWHLGIDADTANGAQERNWFDAPALDQAWWQTEERRVVLYFHDDGDSQFGAIRQTTSQDMGGANVTTFACRPIVAGRSARFLSVLVPYGEDAAAAEVAARVHTAANKTTGSLIANIGATTVTVAADGQWQVARAAAPAAPKSRLVAKLESGEAQTVVTYGTSLTAGGAWVGQLRAALDAAYPGKASVVNSGAGGMWSTWGVENLDARVLAKKPDTVLIEFGINDAYLDYKTSVAKARSNLENMIGRILESNPDCEIVLMVMNPPIKVHLERRPKIKDYYQMYRQVAKERKLTLIDHYPAWDAILKADPERFDSYVPDGIHPGPQGCAAVITPAVVKALGIEGSP